MSACFEESIGVLCVVGGLALWLRADEIGVIVCQVRTAEDDESATLGGSPQTRDDLVAQMGLFWNDDEFVIVHAAECGIARQYVGRAMCFQQRLECAFDRMPTRT